MVVHDYELLSMLLTDPPLVEGLQLTADPYHAASPVQAASIDLAVGEVLLPETGADELGGLSQPRTEFQLMPGRTAVVLTRERLHLPADLAAVAFPPARVSARGLLTTNPGHIDPGFIGRLSFTVINMGRAPYLLEAGRSIVTLVFLRMDSSAHRDWSVRRDGRPASGVSAERMAVLSADFLDVERRAEDVAQRKERDANRRAIWLTAGITLVVALITLVGTILAGGLASNDTVNDLKTKVAVLEARLSGLGEQ